MQYVPESTRESTDTKIPNRAPFQNSLFATKRDFGEQITQPSKNQNKSKKADDLSKRAKRLENFRQIAIELCFGLTNDF